MTSRASLACAIVMGALTAAACTATGPVGPEGRVAAASLATTVSRGDGPFTVAWSLAAPGRIVGRVKNEYHDPARRIRLLVEARDAADRVVSQKYEWLAGDAIGPNGERYFEVRNVPPADRYRVLVHSWEIIQAPGCCLER